MDVSRFTEADWDSLAERFAAREGGFAKRQDLAAWLVQGEHLQDLDAKFGTGQWTLSDALTMATGGPLEIRRASKKRLAAAAVAPEPVKENVAVELPSLDKYQERIQARVKLYLDMYAIENINDLGMVNNLASGDILSELINEMILRETLSETPIADKIQKLGASLVSITTGSAKMQDSLGISKKARDAVKEQDSDYERVQAQLEGAMAYVEKEGIPLQHTCGEYMGVLFTSFRELAPRVSFDKCPLCGQKDVVFTYTPTAADLQAVEPEWVAAEEAQWKYAYTREEEET